MSRQPFGERINHWLAEAPGQVFTRGKWRFWWPAITAFTLFNAALTAIIFNDGGRLQAYMGAVLVGAGALLVWLCVGFLHYSDGSDRRLARGVSALDSITLCFVIAHFCGLFWVYGRLHTLQTAEVAHNAQVEKYNAEARQVSADNAKIAESLAKVSEAEKQRARIENDSIYQARKAAEAGVRIAPRRGSAASSSLSTSPVELARPPEALKDSAADFLTRWDAWIRLANFGELILAAITLIFIRNRSAKTNSPMEISAAAAEFFPTGRYRSPLPQSRFDQTTKSDRGTTVVHSGDSFNRKAARRKLLDHLGVISSYSPGKWFKADLVDGGIHIRMCARVNTIEETIADTRQSDRLLQAVDRPDFRERLIEELRHQGFEI